MSRYKNNDKETDTEDHDDVWVQIQREISQRNPRYHDRNRNDYK